MHNAAKHKETRLRNIEPLVTKAQFFNVIRFVMIKDVFCISPSKAMHCYTCGPDLIYIYQIIALSFWNYHKNGYHTCAAFPES